MVITAFHDSCCNVPKYLFFVRGLSDLMDLEIDLYFVYILGTILVEYE